MVRKGRSSTAALEAFPAPLTVPHWFVLHPHTPDAIAPASPASAKADSLP